MSIINFSIPKTLEKKVVQIIKEKGFSSKAEFFRFAAINFIDILEKRMIEHRKKEILKDIKLGRNDYKRNKVHRGSVQDLINEI